MIFKILLFLSTGILGTFFGTQLAEAALIVPFWKDLSADEFFGFYKTYGKKLHQFYAPLTIAAVILPIATLVCSLFSKSKTDLLMWLMVFFVVLFFATFFVYFKEANLSFTERTISNEALTKELIKWSNWHWGRVICEGLAFGCGLVLLLKGKY
ncbi:MAG: DUF1772 domain-containing protein [Arcicella sp.]|nr:DUF1772 domain-containing protein [Arcicella sp.]